ncbi:MAG: zinc-dependent metalloprotease family protein, partial [Bacteroidota bacterium]
MIYRLLGLMLLIGSSLSAQHSFFSPHTPKAADALGYEQRVTPTKATYYAVSAADDLAKVLRGAPREAEGTTPLLLKLPDPTGNVSTFRIIRYQMITDELQARYPHYVTAYGWDVDAPNRKIFLEWTDLGFGASVTGGAEGRWYIAPHYWQRQDLYQSYFTKDYPNRRQPQHCGFFMNAAVQEAIEALGPPTTKSVGDCELREYDLALACTGEYYAAVGGTEALVVAEMMTAINRVNEVFRADLAITLKLINLPVAGGGIELVFDNPVSDPYDNEDGDAMLGQNQTTIDNVIGSANYDIGHVFSTGGGGIAALGSPCNINAKARGVTGLPNPTGDPFYTDFVAHEIGHQFGGQHTFNSTE